MTTSRLPATLAASYGAASMIKRKRSQVLDAAIVFAVTLALAILTSAVH